MFRKLMSGVAIAALTVPSAMAPALAQEEPEGEQTKAQQQQGETQAQDQSGDAQQQAQSPMTDQPDDSALVAKVGDAEITGKDVREAIGALPERVKQNPPERLVPLMVDQLILRELILTEARDADLEDDDAVKSAATAETDEGMEEAMVQVWLRRELDDRVTDQKIQAVYDDLKAENPDQALPPLEQVRPQIAQRVQQQAVAEIRDELRQDADVTLYGPDGEPLGDDQTSGG